MGTAAPMVPGIILIIVGAIFTFALRAESSWLDVRVLGLILMLGGAAFIARSRVKRRDRQEAPLRDSRTEHLPS
jgi:uncharacterized membrane protein HdeD (DUF308 family)